MISIQRTSKTNSINWNGRKKMKDNKWMQSRQQRSEEHIFHPEVKEKAKQASREHRNEVPPATALQSCAQGWRESQLLLFIRKSLKNRRKAGTMGQPRAWVATPVLLSLCSVQSLSRVRLFVTPWTAAHQASLSIINSQSLPKLMSIESVMPSNHLIRCRPLLLLPSIFPSITL